MEITTEQIKKAMERQRDYFKEDFHGKMFPQMSTIVPPGQKGVAKVSHFTVTSDELLLHNARSIIGHGDPYGMMYPGTYARLSVNGQLVMTDTNMERVTNERALRAANGRVLIAGLGLGMILHPILKKEEVEHVTVIEMEQDVIDLIKPTLPKTKKLEIIAADIFEWPLPREAKWDTIYFDIWADISEDNLPQMAKLSRKFARRLNRSNPKAWMGSWRQRYLQAQRDRNRRGYW